jgi:cell fate (sporulation/competence/biofilm development) regulator YlbF (YheA/YmcA/DUF963 family)
MNKIIDSAKELREELLKDELIKEYLRVKQIFENDEEIKDIRFKLVLFKNENKLDEYQKMKEIYDSHPIVRNFFILKEEVSELIKDIVEVLDL